MVNNNFDNHITNRTIDYSRKETVASHRIKTVFKTIGLIIGNIFTLGILGTVLDLRNQRTIRNLQLGKGNSLVQAQRRKIAELKMNQTTQTSKEKPYAKIATDPTDIAGKANSDKNHRYFAKGLTIDAVDNDEDDTEDYIKNNSTEALFKSAFEHIFNELCADQSLQFSKNKGILADEYTAQRAALAKLMILDLIEEATLQTNPCGTVDLHLNNNITVYQNNSEKILRKNANGQIEQTEVYLEQKAFTPSNNGTVKGLIDPCGVKYIIAKISDQEKEALKAVLSRSLTDDASQELIDAKALIAGNQDLNYAMAMIERIATGIEERYKNAFNVFWEFFATEDIGDLPTPKAAEEVGDLPNPDNAVNQIAANIPPITTELNKKTNSTARNILKAIGIMFLNLSTLYIYSFTKYIINQRKINQLDPVTRTASLACQRKLYNEIDSLENINAGGFGIKLDAIDPKIEQQLGPMEEENELKHYQKRVFHFDNVEAPIDMDVVDVEVPDQNHDPIGFNDYAWRLSNKKTLENTTMERLLITAFDKIYERLLDKSENGHIQFSRNENWALLANKHTVLTRIIILDLIEKAQMTYSHENDVNTLHLNGDLQVGQSIPEIITKKVEGQLRNECMYLQNDPWTPIPFENNPNPVERGIDPIGIKWILEQLDSEKKSHLERLLLDEFIPDDNADLIATKDYMRRNQHSQDVKLIKQALHLIQEVAKSLDTRYGSLLKTLWKKNANQDEDENGVLAPEKKPEVEIPLAAADDVVAWEPAVDLPANLKPIFNRTRKQTQDLWSDMNRNILGNPKHTIQENQIYNLTNGIRDQFIVKHEVLRTGCLYGAFTSLIAQNRNDINQNTEYMIMRAMGDYLAGNKRDYEAKIRQDLNMSFDNLVSFLKDQGQGAYSFTNVEAEIFAHTFGIKVQVFGPGCSIKVENGLMQSEGFTVGPNTKECLYLYCNNGSWYSACPKLKEPDASVPADQAAAIRQTRTYWQPAERVYQNQ